MLPVCPTLRNDLHRRNRHTFLIFTALLLCPGPVLDVAFFSSQAMSEFRPPSSLEAALLDFQPVTLISSDGPSNALALARRTERDASYCHVGSGGGMRTVGGGWAAPWGIAHVFQDLSLCALAVET